MRIKQGTWYVSFWILPVLSADSPLAVGCLFVDDALGTKLRIWGLETSILELSRAQAEHSEQTNTGDNERFHFWFSSSSGFSSLSTDTHALSFLSSITVRCRPICPTDRSTICNCNDTNISGRLALIYGWVAHQSCASYSATTSASSLHSAADSATTSASTSVSFSASVMDSLSVDSPSRLASSTIFGLCCAVWCWILSGRPRIFSSYTSSLSVPGISASGTTT